MVSRNYDIHEDVKHCVLIDGDFGRHELFNNIHSYTLNRRSTLNDAFTSIMPSDQVMKIMQYRKNLVV